jgi:hypothetical protein
MEGFGEGLGTLWVPLQTSGLAGDRVTPVRLQDLRGGGLGAAYRPRRSDLSGTIGRLCRPIVPEKKDSWRAFALQTSHQGADCVSPVR